MLLSVFAHGFVLSPILIVLLYNLFKHDYARRHFYCFAGVGAIWQIFSAGASFLLFYTQSLHTYSFSIFWDISSPGAAHFSLDYLKLFLLLIIGFVSLVSVLIARHTIDFNRSSYTNLLMILMLGMNGMLLVTDLFSLYVFMEVTGICCFVMIAMFRSRADLEGSFKYLVMSELASIFILTGLAFLFMKTGSLQYRDLLSLGNDLNIHDLPDFLLPISIVFLISGFALKTGIVPFHSWLPDAHQSADTSVSVLLSGIVIKIAGIYGLYCVGYLFHDFSAVQTAYAVLGLISIFVGALLAMQQGHFKRVVAYSSVSQMGYILLGLSTGTTLGLIGTLAHILSHALFKSALFANAAALHEQIDSLELKDMGGLENQMPKTAFSSVIAFLSTAGIPPMTGFWSKLLILLALWQSKNYMLSSVALLASIFTASYLIRIQKLVFFGAKKETLSQVKEVKGSIQVAQMLLTCLTIGIGLFYPFFLYLLQNKGLL